VLGPLRGNDIRTALRTLISDYTTHTTFPLLPLFLVGRVVSIDTTQNSVKERLSQFPKKFSVLRLLKIILLGFVLAAVAVTLKIRIETPEGRHRHQPPASGEGRPGVALNAMRTRRLPPPWSGRVAAELLRRARRGRTTARLRPAAKLLLCRSLSIAW